MSVDFSKLLSKNTDTIEKPKPVPTGTYFAVVGGHRFDVSTKKKTPYVEFEITLQQPDEDVDPDALDLFGGSAKLATKKMNYTFYITDDAEWRLLGFLECLGLNTSGRTLGELIPETQGQPLKVSITHSVNERDPETPFANISDHTSAD